MQICTAVEAFSTDARAHACKGVVGNGKIAQGGVHVCPVRCSLEGKVVQSASQLVVACIQHHHALHICQAGGQCTCMTWGHSLGAGIRGRNCSAACRFLKAWARVCISSWHVFHMRSMQGLDHILSLSLQLSLREVLQHVLLGNTSMLYHHSVLSVCIVCCGFVQASRLLQGRHMQCDCAGCRCWGFYQKSCCC